ncbi:MAG: RNA polymerase sigma factor [Candidatus Binatia bacterium]
MMTAGRDPRGFGLIGGREADDRLVERLRRGDRAAAHSFYETHASKIRRFILQALGGGSDADADDLLHETFLGLAEALPYFRGQSSLYTFACAIAHRKVASFFRSRRRRERFAASLPEPPPAEAPSDEHGDLRRALRKLKVEQREVLYLKYVESFSVREIASVVQTSERAVESLLARGRRKLRAALREP